MNSRISLLSLLAVVQLLIIAGFWFSGSDEVDSQGALLAVDGSVVTGIRIDDGDNSVQLRNTDGEWLADGVPADQDKVEKILARLTDLAAPWPVASTSASAKRFEVGDEGYQRRIQLDQGEETLALLYLGTSPGYQKVHARRGGSDEVYSVSLSNYELGADVDAWLDKNILAMPAAPTLVRATFSDTEAPASEAEAAADPASAGATSARVETLQKGAEGWLYNEAAADQEAAQTYANRYQNLTVLGLAEDAGPAQPLASIDATTQDATRTYTISRLPAKADGTEGDYVISRADLQNTYRLATYVAEQLLMTDVTFAAAVIEEPAGETEGQAGGG